MKKKFLPYNSQKLDKSDIKSVMNALKSPYLTTGPVVDEFEKELANIWGLNMLSFVQMEQPLYIYLC